jgi:hypothetical protein
MGSDRLMRVMAKQAIISSIKLPDGKYTQTGEDTLKELFRFDEWGQQNVDVCVYITNRGD